MLLFNMKKLLIMLVIGLFLIAGCSSNVDKETPEPVIEEPAVEPVAEETNVVTGNAVKEKLRTILLDEEFELESGETNYFEFTTRKDEYYKIVVQLLDSSGRYYDFLFMAKEECDKYKNSGAYTAIVSETDKENSYYYDNKNTEKEAKTYCLIFKHSDSSDTIVKKRVKAESCNYVC